MAKKNTTSTPWLAILAGLTAIRGVEGNEEAIEKAVPRLLAAGSKVQKPSDGTAQTGRFTGKRIMEFQDLLYGHNMTKGWGFTDAELATAWRAEFPTARCNFAVHHRYVTSARGDLNRDKRGMKLAQLTAQFGFEGKVTQFFTPVKEKVAKAKKEKAPKAAPVVEETVAQLAETVEPVAQ